MAEKKGKGAFFGDDDFSIEPEVDTSVAEEVAVGAADAVGAAEDLSKYAVAVGTQGRKGQKAPRMNLAIPEDVYEYIRRESRKEGMTYSEFICAVMRQRRDNSK